jgi:hypothetical protein
MPDAVLDIFSVLVGRNGIDSGNEYCTVTVTRAPTPLQGLVGGVQATPVGNPAHAVVTVMFPGFSAG